MAWTPKDYDEALAEQEANPHPDLAAAIAKYESMHNPAAAEEHGAKEGFVSQQFPTSGMPRTEREPPPAPAERVLAPTTEERGAKQGFVTQQFPAFEQSPEALMVAREEHFKRLQRPSEHIVPAEAGLESIYNFIPSYFGGRTEMWNEPSLQEFREQTGLRDKGLDSPEYKHFADAMWAHRYDAAAAKGENVVRTAAAIPAESFDNATFARRAVDQAVHGLAGTLSSGMGGLLEGYTGGLVEPNEAAKDLMEEYPVGRAAGALYGATRPTSAISRFDSLVKQGVPALAERGAGVVGNTLRGAARGALVGGAIAGADDALHAGDADEVSLFPAGVLGGLLGGSAAGFGAGMMGRLRNPLHAQGRALNEIETALAGGEENAPVRGTKFFSLDPRVTPGVESAMEESLTPGVNRAAGVPDILAQRAAPAISKAALAERAALEAEIGATNERFYNSPGGKTPTKPTNFVNWLFKTINERSPAGFQLPFAKSAEFKTALNNTMAVIPDLDGTIAQNVALRQGGTVMSYEQAQSLGLSLEGIPQVEKVVVVPLAMTARHFDTITEGLDNLAKASSKTGAVDSALEAGQRAIREDRGKFRWDPSVMGPEPKAILDDGTEVTGWNAYKRLASERLGELEQRMGDAGIPAGKNVTPLQAEAGVLSRAKGFRQGERANQDEALMSFMGGETGPLWDIAAAHAAGNMGQPTLSTQSAGAIRNAQILADPFMDAAKRGALQTGVVTGTGSVIPGLTAFPGDIMGLADLGPKQAVQTAKGKKGKRK
jgi:hypothetical protein